MKIKYACSLWEKGWEQAQIQIPVNNSMNLSSQLIPFLNF